MSDNRFEKILLHYGAYVLCRVLEYAKASELYEDCIEISSILRKYHIREPTTKHDWQSELWRFGYSGENALSNAEMYYYDAMKIAGYVNNK